MADSPAFGWLCQALEDRSEMNSLESRGTVRIALKEAGFQASGVTASELAIVVTKLLPAELEARGVPNAPALCQELARDVEAQAFDDGARPDSPEQVFRRLGSQLDD